MSPLIRPTLLAHIATVALIRTAERATASSATSCPGQPTPSSAKAVPSTMHTVFPLTPRGDRTPAD